MTYADAPMVPGSSALRTFSASPGAELSFIQMYGESNDVFVATSSPVALFADGALVAGSVLSAMALYDAGTEVNQEPGLGSDQPKRQAAPDQGEVEGGTITALNGPDSGGYSYPDLESFLAVDVLLSP